jgi:hypothetical protein
MATARWRIGNDRRMPAAASIKDPDDLPALYRGADSSSLNAQRTFLWWTKLRLGAVVAAAFGGAITWDVGRRDIRLAAWLALIAFGLALVAELVLAITRPDRVWYEGRAAAESVKTLAWRYMMRAESYESPVADVDQRFTNEIFETLDDLNQLEIPPAHATDVQITARMREVRALDFDSRRTTYLDQRIRDQQGWYAGKARLNKRTARLWIGVSIGLEVMGAFGAALKVAHMIDFDLLGICATGAAAAAAWVQAKQYQTLSTAYSVTSQELAAVASEVEALHDEALWPQFVAEAEEAISREHTLWRASRGIRVRRRHG